MGLLETIIERNLTEEEKEAERKALNKKSKNSFGLGGFQMNSFSSSFPAPKVRRMTRKEKMMFLLEFDEVIDVFERGQRGEITVEQAIDEMQKLYEHFNEYMVVPEY